MAKLFFQGWTLALYASLISFMVVGLMDINGVLFPAIMLQENLSRGTASWPLNLPGATVVLISPVAGFLSARFSLVCLTAVGTSIYCLGILPCYFSANIYVLSLFYGLVKGVGLGIVMVAITSLISTAFKHNRSTAMGIATAGRPIAGLTLPLLTQFLLEKYELNSVFLLITGIALHAFIGVCGLMSYQKMQNLESQTEKIKAKDDKRNSQKCYGSTVSTKECGNSTLQHNSKSLFDDNVVVNKNDGNNSIVENRENLNTDNDLPKSSNLTCSTTLDSLGHNRILPGKKLEVSNDSVGDEGNNRTLPGNISEVPNDSVGDKGNNQTQPCNISELPKDSVGDKGNNRTLPGNKSEVPKDERTTSENSPLRSPETKKGNFNKLTLLHIFTSKAFYLFAGTEVFISYVSNCFIQVVIDYLADKGIEASLAVLMITSSASGEIVGRLGLGWISDKNFVSKQGLLAIASLVISAVTVGCTFTNEYWLLMISAFLLGMCYGSALSVNVVQMTENFAKAEIPLAVAVNFSLKGLSAVTRSPVIGFFRDDLGSYDYLFRTLAALVLLLAISWTIEGFCFRKKTGKYQSIEKTP